MTANEPSGIARDLRALFDSGALGALTDRELLDRFVDRRDPAAFSALVGRHGPMVWGVCRRALGDPNDAADAFQATFLVLARKAGSVRVEGSLGRWLHGVGRKVAGRARASAARRAARERPGVEEVAALAPDPDRPEVLAALDEEIGRLPERYRSAVLLCDLERLPHEEAARRLGCAVGTVGSRLSRARERLRDRLTRRGLAPGPGGLAALISTQTPPPNLADSATTAALRLVAGGVPSASAGAYALSKDLVPTMILTRRNLAAALALLTTSGLAVFSLAAPLPKTRKQDPAAPPADDLEAIRALMLKTYAEARSYQDEGEVVTVFNQDGNLRTVRKPFRTWFVRPNLFRYQFSDQSPGFVAPMLYVIWGDASPKATKTWWTIQPKVEVRDLSLAIGAAAGVSANTSSNVPSLLMPEVLGLTYYLHMKGPKLVGVEEIEGAPCHKVEYRNFANDPTTIWVDKRTHLLRKIFVTSQFPGFSTEETTTYRPSLDPEIPAAEFAFEPPKP